MLPIDKTVSPSCQHSFIRTWNLQGGRQHAHTSVSRSWSCACTVEPLLLCTSVIRWCNRTSHMSKMPSLHATAAHAHGCRLLQWRLRNHGASRNPVTRHTWLQWAPWGCQHMAEFDHTLHARGRGVLIKSPTDPPAEQRVATPLHTAQHATTQALSEHAWLQRQNPDPSSHL